MDARQLTAVLKEKAQRLGFDLAGVCAAQPPPGLSRFTEWLNAGYAGQMHYLANRADAYQHPAGVLEGAKSVVMLAMNYHTADPDPPRAGQGRISRYAWGTDYHDVIHDRLKSLCAELRLLVPGARARGVVDSAPLLEREFAQLAGLGWIGKNTLLLNKKLGSLFFLAALVTDVELEYDAAHETDHCGTCRACLDACPTDAFVDAYVLDSRRCISYLTIELRGAIPPELRHGMSDWLFGCDICQDVCPWNHRAPRTAEPAFQPRSSAGTQPLAEMFFWSDAEFRQRFADTPLWRPKRRGLLRNAAIILGNQRHRDALPALKRGLMDIEPLVRGACAWGIGQFIQGADRLASESAEQTLKTRRGEETDADVICEIDAMLAASSVKDCS